MGSERTPALRLAAALIARVKRRLARPESFVTIPERQFTRARKDPAMSGARSLDYVRSYYGLAVKRGDRVTVFGRPGRVTSGDGQYVRVRFDGGPSKSLKCHPRDLVFMDRPRGES